MKKPIILIVDDEQNVLNAISRSLRELNCELILVDNPDEAIRVINEKQLDVIVADYHMPGNNGLYIIKIAKEVQPDTIRILMTGDSDIDIVVNAVNEGNIFKYIAKPWNRIHLVQLISEAVKNKLMHDEKQELFAIIFKEKSEWSELKKELEHKMISINRQGVQALIKVMRAKDNALYLHSMKVAYVANLIGMAINYSEKDLKYLKLAALFHDIGKIAIRDNILYKEGQLDDYERKQMNYHATVSAEILKEIDFMQEVAEVVRQHHERFDGTGYPKGLAGEKIAHYARVLAIADVYVALREQRIYKEEKSSSESLEIIASEAGKSLDPVLVETAQSILKDLVLDDEKLLQDWSELI